MIEDLLLLSTGNRGFKETFFYLFTCLPVYQSTCLSAYLSTCLHVYPSTRLLVYPSICRPVDPSTCLPVDLSTCRPVYGSLLLKKLSSRQGESERALLCKMWQGKADMSVLSTENRGFKETSVYLFICLPVDLSTCLPVYMSTCLLFLTFKAFKFKTLYTVHIHSNNFISGIPRTYCLPDIN